MNERLRIIQGDALEQLRLLPGESVHCVVTSPPYYGLRDYKTGTWEGGGPSRAYVEAANEAQAWIKGRWERKDHP